MENKLPLSFTLGSILIKADQTKVPWIQGASSGAKGGGGSLGGTVACLLSSGFHPVSRIPPQ